MSTPDNAVQTSHALVQADILGEPYVVETIELTPDDEGAVEANLVRLAADEPNGRAVLYVHGFCDYFFQREFAQWWADRGYDFYALDLRKYGRSLRPHHTPNYIADVREYFEEIDEAWMRVTRRDGHQRVILAAHSTGGLITSLWADDRRPVGLDAMFLNSPWLDLQGPAWMRTVGTAAVNRIGGRQPKRPIPRKLEPFYGQSLHRDHGGEWDYDLALKPIDSWPIYFGWMRAIRQAHKRVHTGLAIPCPILVLCSGGSHWPRQMSEEVYGFDIVLDVAQIRRWSPALGEHVTVVSIEGAVHDVILSRPPVRARAYEELDRWLTAYVEPAGATARTAKSGVAQE